MQTFRARFILTAVLLALAVLVLSVVPDSLPRAEAADREFTVAWSVWTGWMPFRILKDKGLLDRRAKEQGVKIKLKEFKDYMASVTAFGAGEVDACAMTSMESFQPASNGVKVVGILVNDTSNGGDGVLVRKGMKLQDLKGQSITLAEFSVSHYLLARALSMNGMSDRDVKIKNVVDGDEAGKAFLTDESVKAVVTWNPHLFLAQEGGKGEVIFSSAQIPGEIIDLLVMNDKAIQENPKVAQAIVDAWYDAMAMIVDPKTHAEAVQIMADGAGTKPDEFERMLKGTDLYTDPGRGAEFLAGKGVQETMGRIKDFIADHGILKDRDVSVSFDAKYTREYIGRKGAH
ncbi:MAG: ABC transporter substrate-binding protein [Planctomycetes bacterium]|nr:ABC transporter substrate-binding protein [Planctomycetota bacterium]